MLDTREFQVPDLSGLSPEAAAAATQAILSHVNEQAQQISRQDQELRFKDAKLQKLTFELTRHKAWRFGAKTERMNAEQRQIFEETAAEDQASLEAQIQALKGKAAQADTPAPDKAKRPPRRQSLPDHLRRVDHHHEPENTTCPTPECGQAMARVGEDVSERLDIVPAEFFVHRHIYGKWACRCCHLLTQEPAEPQIVDGGIPAAGLVAHTLVSRFADHIPYYRQETINARSGVHTPRSTLASWSGAGGAALEPLYEALRSFVLSSAIVQADETPVAMLDPGAGKTKKSYIWGYARGAFDVTPAVVYDFCTGRGARFPVEFLGSWPPLMPCAAAVS